MARRKGDWRTTKANYQVHTKDGRFKFLVDVVKAYELAYPGRFRYYLNEFKKLRQVYKTADGSFTDERGRVTHVDRFPTEPYLFVQRWIPDFGQEAGDMDLIKKAWEDFVCTPNKRHFKHRTLWKGGAYSAAPQATKEANIWGPTEPVHESRPGSCSAADREGNACLRCAVDPCVCDDDYEERSGGVEEVSGLGEEVVPATRG